MDLKAYHISSDISLSLSDDTFYHTEVLAGHRLLIWIISGQTIVEQSGGSTSFHAGSKFIISHNQVVRLVNSTPLPFLYQLLSVCRTAHLVAILSKNG
jgi:hypothetical protein